MWEEVDAFVNRHADEIRSKFTLLVAILRSGAPIAAALARKTGLPVDYMFCNRYRPKPEFIDGEVRAPHGQRILLVDDISGTGWTFRTCADYCRSLGNEVGTMSIYYCDAPGMFRPDYADPMDATTYLRWPWEYQDEPEMPQ
jgi:adenine/guanine phosphoribosyltransferase-like PRPP-binding protein